MSAPEPAVIGLDIGASKMLAGLVTADGAVSRVHSRGTPAGPDSVLKAARQLCQRLAEECDGELVAIGIGSAGIINSDNAKVAYANENLPGWTGADLSRVGIRGLPVIAENDARALAYGEAILGAGKRFPSLLCVTVGSGIGGGLILNGEVWHGAGYCAGEIGYLVVGWHDDEPLILDQFVSGPAMERAYQRASGAPNPLPLTEISRRAKAGESLAAAAIESKARQFGLILAGIAASLAPDAIVIGGGVPEIGALWREAFEAGFRAFAPPLLRSMPLLPARLGVEAVMLGAAMLAWRRTAA